MLGEKKGNVGGIVKEKCTKEKLAKRVIFSSVLFGTLHIFSQETRTLSEAGTLKNVDNLTI